MKTMPVLGEIPVFFIHDITIQDSFLDKNCHYAYQLNIMAFSWARHLKLLGWQIFNSENFACWREY